MYCDCQQRVSEGKRGTSGRGSEGCTGGGRGGGPRGARGGRGVRAPGVGEDRSGMKWAGRGERTGPCLWSVTGTKGLFTSPSRLRTHVGREDLGPEGRSEERDKRGVWISAHDLRGVLGVISRGHCLRAGRGARTPCRRRTPSSKLTSGTGRGAPLTRGPPAHPPLHFGAGRKSESR